VHYTVVIIIVALIVKHTVVFGHFLRGLLPQHPAEVDAGLHNILWYLSIKSN